MSGPELLIVAIIIVLVIAFIITTVLQNATAKKILSANSMLVENQNALLEQNKELTEKLKESKEALENATQRESTPPTDEVTKLRQQTQQIRKHITQTSQMTDEELLVWLDRQMEETHLFIIHGPLPISGIRVGSEETMSLISYALPSAENDLFLCRIQFFPTEGILFSSILEPPCQQNMHGSAAENSPRPN